jgi:phage/conjugal plasmid C-4 type zinc finger TraR family protein
MDGIKALRNPDEHMNDDELVDHAEQFHTDLALLQHQQRTAIDPNALSADWCEDCETEIPELRRQTVPGVTLCVDCQREVERQYRLYR